MTTNSAIDVGSTSITTLGTVSTGTWSATNIALNKGGTNAALTASNGGIFYSTASAGAILSGTATANQLLMSGSSTTPAWSTATYPATTTVSQILYSSSANVVGGLATANNSILATNGSGVPSLTTTLPTAVQVSVSSLNSGTAASSTTYWRGDGTWATTSGITGAWTKISTATASSSASITFTGLTSSYSEYMVVMYNVTPGTTNVNLYFRTSTDNGSNYDTTGYSYGSYLVYTDGLNYGTAAANSGQINLATTSSGIGLPTTAGTALGANLIIYNPASSTAYKSVTWAVDYQFSSTQSVNGIGGGCRHTTTAINAIQFLMSSGNIATGSFILYGLTT